MCDHVCEVKVSPAEIDARFRLLGAICVIVPEGYEGGTSLSTFKMRHEGDFLSFSGALTDSFPEGELHLSPGRKFRVELHAVKEHEVVDTYHSMIKIKRAGGALLGAHGIVLLYEQVAMFLPPKHSCISFNEKNETHEMAMVAYLDRLDENNFMFEVESLARPLVGPYDVLTIFIPED